MEHFISRHIKASKTLTGDLCHYQKAEEYRAQREAVIKEKQENLIIQHLNSYFNGSQTEIEYWPDRLHDLLISGWECKRNLVEKIGIGELPKHLEIVANLCILKFCREYFAKEFFAVHEELNSSSSTEEWINAYFDSFGDNEKYLILLPFAGESINCSCEEYLRAKELFQTLIIERHLKQREMEEKRIASFQPQIDFHVLKFIQLYITEWGTWPEKINISESDIDTFKIYLEDELSTTFSSQVIRQILDNTVFTIQRNWFLRSFEKLYPELSTTFDLEKWVKTYIETFGPNIEYLPYISAWFGCNQIDFGALDDTYNRMIEELKKKKRIEQLRDRMDGSIDTNQISIETVDNLQGLEFEKFLGQLFRKMGYSVKETMPTRDQGADLIIEKFGQKAVVQAKRYQGHVGNDSIQQAFASKAYYCCHEGIVITNSFFTQSAEELAGKTNIKLWNRNKLAEMIRMHW